MIYHSNNFDFYYLKSFDFDYSKNFLNDHWNSIQSESLSQSFPIRLNSIGEIENHFWATPSRVV